jgi:hypothetical protein
VIRTWAGIACGMWAACAAPARGAIWKATVELGTVGVYAEMNDATDPVVVLIRVENHSKLQSVPISEYFVQMMDGKNRYLRPVTADDVASVHLQRLREDLPRYGGEIDTLLGSIRADYPQEKIVAVYGRLQEFFAHGHPLRWRRQVENWFLARRESTPVEFQAAQDEVTAIGTLSRNYLWPRDVAPQAVYTGTLFFERSTQDPVSIYFQIGKEFLGTKMVQSAGGDAK